MFDTATLTIVGNVVADPRISGLPDDPDRVSFRVVSNRRRRNPESGEWVDAGEYGVNVVCWRRLARGVSHSLRRGDPVLVTGRISDREFVGNDGERRWFTEVTADFVGHDLSKGTAQFYRFSRLDRITGPGQDGTDDPARASDTDLVDGAGDGAAQQDLVGDAPAGQGIEWPEPQLAGA